MNITTFERGLQQGEERGLQRGRAEGQQQALRIWLEEKFGPLSTAVIQRLDALPADQIQTLLRAAVKASSLRELGLED